MNILGINMPLPIVVLLGIAVAYWYVFMRSGKKKIKDDDLEQSRKDDEYYRHQVSISQSKKAIEDSKKRKTNL